MAQACFSDIEYTTRTACSSGQCVPSQDINRRQPGNYPVLAPANGEVMIVDVEGGNADRGNFVAIRIPISNVPSSIRDSIPELKGQTQGYLYIGYAHLSRVDVSANSIVSSGQQLGVSGQTGLENVPGARPHLDLAMFFIPNDAQRSSPFWISGNSGYADHNMFNTLAYQIDLYPPGTSLPLDVKPSDVWPELLTCPE